MAAKNATISIENRLTESEEASTSSSVSAWKTGSVWIDGLDLLAHLCGDGAGIELSAKEDGQVFGGRWYTLR